MTPFWTGRTVAEALGVETGRADATYAEVATDTRTLGRDALFVALEGERFDAHDFLGQAVERGAGAAVVSRVPADAPEELTYYRVDDTLRALGRLARYRRRRLSARVCAITGTNGKTTTKELTRAVLSDRYRVHATSGNLNNLVGGPLTLLAAPDDAEAIVVELGTNAPGEIARLAGIVEPDAAIITGVAEGHLEGLGSLEGVLEEKTSLLAALPPDGAAFVADEPPELVDRARELASRLRVAGWSDRADAELRGTGVKLDPEGRVHFRWRDREVRLAFRGRPNARNALLALGVGRAWGVEPDAAVSALAGVEPPKLRSEIHRFGGLRVIADCYNANPASVAAAVDLLGSVPADDGRVAVVGTMNELGGASARLHRRVAGGLAESGVDLIVATGEFAEAFAGWADRLGERLIRAEDPLEAYEALAGRLRGREVVLLKGSRGVALERLLERFEADWARSGTTDEAEGRHERGDGAPHSTGE